MATELTIVIPVYNEGANFPRLWETLTSSIRTPFRALVVYDFDEDNTVPAVRSFINGGEKRLQLVRNAYGRGVVGAIRTGFDMIRSGPVLVTMADLCDDVRQVDAMVGLYDRGFDIVAASRYMKSGGIINGPFLKQGMSRLGGLTLHWLRRVPTHDATNAFKIYDASMLRSLRLESTGGFELSLEITVKAFLAGYRIAEIPTVWRERTEGKSRFKLWSWLPRYLKWYVYAFQPKRHSIQRRQGSGMIGCGRGSVEANQEQASE
jgi:dolichol-phosphate mannosyltransferase